MAVLRPGVARQVRGKARGLGCNRLMKSGVACHIRTMLTSKFSRPWCLSALLTLTGWSRAEAAAPAETNATSTALTSRSTNAFVVFGRVTDAAGKPLEGVEVSVSCGIGTLFRTGSGTSGTNGDYAVSFGPGVLMGRSMGVGPLGVGFQAAAVYARKKGYYPRGLGREGNIAMTDTTNSAPTWWTNFSGIVRAFEPYRLDFCLERAASLEGTLRTASKDLPEKFSLCLGGEKLPPASSVLGCTELKEEGRFEFKDVPVGHTWWFEASWRKRSDWQSARSKPFVLKEAGSRSVRVEFDVNDARLEVVSGLP